MFDSKQMVLNSTAEIRRQITDISSNNKINGKDIGDFIFDKMITRIDPVEYCEKILRNHLPDKRRFLHDNQKEIIRAVANPKIRKVAALQARQSGKCFAKNTEILMHDGTIKKVQDIKVGDYVMSPKSTPVLVTSLGNGQEEMYEIVSKHGSFIVNKSHILSLKNNGDILNLSVEKFLNLKNIDELLGYRIANNYCNDDNFLNFNFKVIPKGIGEYFGFTIDSEDHLFLLGDYTVVHNTESIASFTGFLLDNYPGMRVGIFTPRIQQAEIDLGRLAVFFQMNEGLLNNKIIRCNKQKIELDNGSFAMAVSGSDQSNIEGFTFDVIVLDEAQKITNYTWSERIVPMGGSTNAKMIKIGTPKFRNHFYESVEGQGSKDWYNVRKDWTECPQLWALDATFLPDPKTKIMRPYSTYVLSLMPKSLKQEMFPDNPDIWTEGEMSVEDFKTQYALHFVDGAGQFLTNQEYSQLTDGDFSWMKRGVREEKYVGGIDFAGSSSEKGDFTHVTVCRIAPNNQKQKVFGLDMQGLSYPDQMNEIGRIFGGPTPLFNCMSIFADYTGCGRPVVETLREEYGMTNLTGIIFNASDTFTRSGMNMKNIMFAQIKNEISYERFKYPKKELFLSSAGSDMNGFYHKMVGEWKDLEAELKMGINKRIEAPSGGNDDCCCADTLANFAAIHGAKHAMPRPSHGRMYNRG